MLIQRRPDLAERITFNFVGTSNNAKTNEDRVVLPMAERRGVAGLISEKPQRIPYADALQITATSDVLLLIGTTEAHYTASKIFNNLMTGRPFLSIYHCKSSAHAILKSAGGGFAHCFDSFPPSDIELEPLVESLEHLALRPGSVGKVDPTSYEPYTARNIAARYARIFDRMVGDHVAAEEGV